MLKNIKRRESKAIFEHELVFDDGHGNGFAFTCDADGKPMQLRDHAMKNLAWCMMNPDKFVRYNKLMKSKRVEIQPAHGECTCGNRVTLEGEHCGVFQCGKCGKWYSVCGQEITPPDLGETRSNENETV